jgi:sporulation protein YlmC with PRC-barrel domain
MKMQTKIVLAAVIAVVMTGFVQAQQSHTTGTAPSDQATVLRALPPDASTVTNWYRQNVYDPSEEKIGEISDVLIEKDGRIGAFIVSVGGFLGLGEKHVAVPFQAIHATQRDGKWWLTMNANKDSLKSAAGYKYDRTKAIWEPA